MIAALVLAALQFTAGPSVVLVGNSEPSRAMIGLLAHRKIEELQAACAGIDVEVRSYKQLGTVLIAGDPFGTRALKGRAEALEGLARIAATGATARLGDLGKDAQSELGRHLDQMGAVASWLANIDDKRQVPLSVKPSVSITLEANGKSLTMLVSMRAVEGSRPDPSKLPTANGREEKAPDPKATTPPPPSLQQRLTYAADGATPQQRSRLVAELYQVIAQETTDIEARWRLANGALWASLGHQVPTKGMAVAEYDSSVRSQLEGRILTSFKNLGFDSDDEAMRFLAAARTTAVTPRTQVEFLVRMPDGTPTGGSFTIPP